MSLAGSGEDPVPAAYVEYEPVGGLCPGPGGCSGALNLHHTFTDPKFRGQGLAGKVVTAAFEYAKEKGLSIMPTCTYIRDGFLKKRPEYHGLVVGASSSSELAGYRDTSGKPAATGAGAATSQPSSASSSKASGSPAAGAAASAPSQAHIGVRPSWSIVPESERADGGASAAGRASDGSRRTEDDAASATAEEAASLRSHSDHVYRLASRQYRWTLMAPGISPRSLRHEFEDKVAARYACLVARRAAELEAREISSGSGVGDSSASPGPDPSPKGGSGSAAKGGSDGATGASSGAGASRPAGAAHGGADEVWELRREAAAVLSAIQHREEEEEDEEEGSEAACGAKGSQAMEGGERERQAEGDGLGHLTADQREVLASLERLRAPGAWRTGAVAEVLRELEGMGFDCSGDAAVRAATGSRAGTVDTGAPDILDPDTDGAARSGQVVAADTASYVVDGAALLRAEGGLCGRGRREQGRSNGEEVAGDGSGTDVSRRRDGSSRAKRARY